MSFVPKNLRYTETHEWVRREEDGTYSVGITDHAQTMMGDLVFLELPAEGSQLTAGETCCTAESVKAASDIIAPLSGKVVAINLKLESSPEVVNKDPYGQGWFFRIDIADSKTFEDLLSSEEYEALLKESH